MGRRVVHQREQGEGKDNIKHQNTADSKRRRARREGDWKWTRGRREDR
jgi:hypothetical protein